MTNVELMAKKIPDTVLAAELVRRGWTIEVRYENVEVDCELVLVPNKPGTLEFIRNKL